MVNFRGRLPLTFADWYGRDTGQRGGVAIITHSGSVGGLIFSSLQANKVGVDYWIATGNEAMLEVADVIDHLSADPGMHTIACFMEGVVDGRKFMAAAEKARAAGKRVVVLKAGESEASLRSTARTYDQAIHESGRLPRRVPPARHRARAVAAGADLLRQAAVDRRRQSGRPRRRSCPPRAARAR